MNINKTIDNKINEVIDQINTIAIAKITEIDKKKMLCTIKLIDKIEILGNRSEVAEIENVPILPNFWNKNIKSASVYDIGDKVVILFCQHSTFNARNSDSPTVSDHNEKYSLNNAIVIGHIKKDGEDNEKTDAWYIKFKDTLFELKEDSLLIETENVELKAKEKIILETNKANIKIKDSLEINSNGANLRDTNKVNINSPKIEIVANNGFKLTSSNIEFNGNLTVNGIIKANDIGITNEPSLNGHIIKYKTHTHTSSVAGTPTSPPII